MHLFKPPPQPQEQGVDLDGTSAHPDSPISSRSRQKSAPAALQTPLQKAVSRA